MCAAARPVQNQPAEVSMLFTIAAILLVLWLLGFATSAVGSIIHVVLVIALVLFLVGLVSGRRTVV